MREKIYIFLVNKHSGIQERYHAYHDNATGVKKCLSWAYLFWLNFAFYCLGCKFLGKKKDTEFYENKKLHINSSESEAHLSSDKSVEDYTSAIEEYDVVSFDIFDTLIFRPFTVPTDVFHLLGERNGIMDFAAIRAFAEYKSRIKHDEQYGNMEVNLTDIWQELEQELGISGEAWMKFEKHVEDSICFANPFMLEVWNRLLKQGKKIVVTSDMYLPKECIESILHKNGFAGYEKLYLSNEYQLSKADGTLFAEITEDYPGKSIIHIGDNPHSDYDMAKKSGVEALLYPNVNKNTLLYRAHDMSAIIGSAYRGVVSTYLYNGLNKYTQEYEYGFIYGGLFVLGYCHFIHDYVVKNKIDKVLFLSRDGDILKQAYTYLYHEDETEYVYWSRKAATKLEAIYDKRDFFKRFIYHKQNQKYTIDDVLYSMELQFLLCECESYGLHPHDTLTNNNAEKVQRFLEIHWDEVVAHYRNQLSAARKYYVKKTENCKKVVAVDIGWAGSGAMSLRYLFKNIWEIPCEIVGIIAGTNTIHNAEPDASEPFIQSGKLVAYLYSQAHNRDLLKKHNLNKDYNVYWELLLSSPTPQFKGFYLGNAVRRDSSDVYDSDLDITYQFGEYDFNQIGISEIQNGIMDFVNEYKSHFGDPINGEFSYMYNISGRDAYAPMLVAASHDERYLKVIADKFKLEKNVV